jgi:hypothetical protein
MKRHFVYFVFALVFVDACSGQYNERIAHLKDAPFSAEAQVSYTSHASSSTWTLELARASDGSVYKAIIDPMGEFKGSASNISIEDATSNCNIKIYPYRSQLRRDNQGHVDGGTSGLSIGLEAEQAQASPSPTIEDIRNKNLREQERISMSPQILNPDAKLRQTSLGQRTVDGMTIFGFQSEHRIDSKTDRVDERWESELGFTYSSTTTSTTEGRVSANDIATLKLVEPPAELFTVQDKYFPPTSTLPNAKTISISGLLSNAELRDQIESILIASGRFTLVPDSKTADLTVLPRIDSDIPGYQANATSHQIQLEFHTPNGTSVFWVTLHLRGASDQWAQSPVINTCFANLWKRVESLRSPSAPIGEELF